MRCSWLALTLLVSSIPAFAVEPLVAPGVRAHYRSEVVGLDAERRETAKDSEWLFERSGSRVKISDISGRHAEQWDHDSAGRVWYSRTFHMERKVIEYQPTDLSMAGIEGSWERIRQIIGADLLHRLTRGTEERTIAGHRAVVYGGVLDDVETKVVWLEGLAIPAFVEKRLRGVRSSLTLISVDTAGADGIVSSGPPVPTDYETLDFSDLGDRESDPFVAALMKYESGWFGHGH